MSKLYNGSICLSDIPKDKVTTSEKNGKKYLNINVWVNDELDQYGNIGSIQLSQSKAEREAGEKKVYIGNIKQPQAAVGPQNASPVNNTVVDDLPF